jgi:ribonuclease BN (tRNA processing enzyme)
VFLGDTSVDVFQSRRLIELMEVPGLVIAVECTYLDSLGAPESWRSRGHCSWSDLEPVITTASHIQFILIHFSRRYTDADIVAYFASRGRPPNVVLWLDSGVC